MSNNGSLGVCFPVGFKASGVSAGIKANGKPDMALIASEPSAIAAGVFTTNKIKAAPVLISQKRLPSKSVRGVVVSSGNANAATGQAGIDTANQICLAAAEELGCEEAELLIAQTGLIGIPLDVEIAQSGVRKAAIELSREGGLRAATAMMTTDTVPKMATRELFDGKVRIGGCAKGAAMLSPSMATMLAVVTTDARISPALLHKALQAAVEESFHCLVVDACRSTNDTVFILANGASEYPEIGAESAEYREFVSALTDLCRELAEMMARDAEGGSKLLRVVVKGAHSRNDARLAALAVAGSTLVKCSLAGEVMYWGRVISELGSSGAQIDPDNITIWYGEHEVCRNSMVSPYDSAAVERYMKGSVIEISADLGSGNASSIAFGCDLTHAYVDENMGKS